MLKPEEINEALSLLNLSPYFYHIKKYTPDPSLWDARIAGATYKEGILRLRTARNDQPDITLEGFEEFNLYDGGEIQVFQCSEDNSPVLGLHTPQIDERYIRALEAANKKLHR